MQVPYWLWSLRWKLGWKLGGRLLSWSLCVIPASAPRSDLTRGVNEWSRAWAQKLREEQHRQLVEEVKQTTKGWQT